MNRINNQQTSGSKSDGNGDGDGNGSDGGGGGGGSGGGGGGGGGGGDGGGGGGGRGLRCCDDDDNDDNDDDNDNYLESMLELLQQFYLKLADCSKTFKIWVGDQHNYCLYCSRCNRAITLPDYIKGIMEIAPIAMLWHFRLASNEGQIHSPFVFPTQESQLYSCTTFDEVRKNMMRNNRSHSTNVMHLRIKG